MSEPIVGMNIEIQGLEKLLDNLDGMDEVLGSETEQVIDRLLTLAQGRLTLYAMAVPQSRYRRTGLLGQLWAGAAHRIRRVQQVGGRFYVEGQVSNARPGIHFVQNLQEQATVHQGRWTTAQRVLEELQPEAERLLGVAGGTTVERAGS